MSRRPTPETDAERREGLIRGNAVPTHVVPVKFAEELERERDEAREQYDNLATEHMLAVNKLAEERDQALMDRANGDMATMTRNHYERLIKERDEAKADAARIADILSGLELRSTEELARLEQERNEALAQVKELIYISERAIALAEIDFENDKFGVVSELRDDLAKIKKSK